MNLDPRARILVLLCVGVLAVVLERPLTLGILAGVCVLPLVYARVPAKWWWRGSWAVLAIAWSTMLSQGMFYSMSPKTPLASLGSLVLYREGLAYGLVQSLRWTAVLVAGLSLVATTPVSKLLSALVRLKVPFGLAFLAVTAWRFLPIVVEEFQIARRARARRGRRKGLSIGLFRPVIAACLRRARGLAEALDARGFDPVAPRTERIPLVWRWNDSVVLAGVAGPTFGLLTVRMLYLAYTGDLWWDVRLLPVYAFARGWM